VRKRKKSAKLAFACHTIASSAIGVTILLSFTRALTYRKHDSENNQKKHVGLVRSFVKVSRSFRAQMSTYLLVEDRRKLLGGESSVFFFVKNDFAVFLSGPTVCVLVLCKGLYV
jgi:hypothetical protein